MTITILALVAVYLLGVLLDVVLLAKILDYSGQEKTKKEFVCIALVSLSSWALMDFLFIVYLADCMNKLWKLKDEIK